MKSSQPMKRNLESILRPQFIVFLFCLFLTGCVGTAPDSQESTYPNVTRIAIPEGWRVGSESHNAAMRVLEFVPSDQTVDRWTDMITIIVVYHRSAADLSDYLSGVREHLPQGCDVPAVFNEHPRLTDHGYEAATLTAACGKSTGFGKGEIMMQKVMMGQNAIFDVQRTWRFAAMQRSQDLPLSDAQRAAGAAYLDTVWLCNVTVETPGCPRPQRKF
jgi:uncharacterized protein YbdZ (MbtH family)